MARGAAPAGTCASRRGPGIQREGPDRAHGPPPRARAQWAVRRRRCGPTGARTCGTKAGNRGDGVPAQRCGTGGIIGVHLRAASPRAPLLYRWWGSSEGASPRAPLLYRWWGSPVVRGCNQRASDCQLPHETLICIGGGEVRRELPHEPLFSIGGGEVAARQPQDNFPTSTSSP